MGCQDTQHFFSKNEKLLTWSAVSCLTPDLTSKSFLLLFFKKECFLRQRLLVRLILFGRTLIRFGGICHGHEDSAVIKQHLIDPEVCIRCNTCEATCPVGAVTHDQRNYVVDVTSADYCMACVPPCPTGSIDIWHMMPRALAYDVATNWNGTGCRTN